MQVIELVTYVREEKVMLIFEIPTSWEAEPWQRACVKSDQRPRNWFNPIFPQVIFSDFYRH